MPGDRGASTGDWRENPHKPVVVGTVDTLVTKALNRGYGIGATMYPIDFALVTNGAQWVIDEVRLAPRRRHPCCPRWESLTAGRGQSRWRSRTSAQVTGRGLR